MTCYVIDDTELGMHTLFMVQWAVGPAAELWCSEGEESAAVKFCERPAQTHWSHVHRDKFRARDRVQDIFTVCVLGLCYWSRT